MNLPAWASDLLQGPVARLATVSASGRPSVTPICFVVEYDIVWSVIDEKPKSGRPLQRLANIADNRNVSLVVDRYDDDWSQLAWVILHGEADAVPVSSHPEALRLLRDKYPRYKAMDLENSLLIRIAVTMAVSWRASGG